MVMIEIGRKTFRTGFQVVNDMWRNGIYGSPLVPYFPVILIERYVDSCARTPLRYLAYVPYGLLIRAMALSA